MRDPWLEMDQNTWTSKPGNDCAYQVLLAYIASHSRALFLPRLLQGIFESRKAFNRLASSRNPLIRTVELERHGQCENDDKSTSNHRSVDTRMVGWLVLVSEDSAANDSTDATGADERSGAESTLPLTADVVRLVRENAGNIGVTSDCGKEDAEIADAVILCEAKEWEP
jgi:hypothetical protein